MEICLTELFYDEVINLLDQATPLGKALGAVARIYKAIATSEVDVGELSRTYFINFQPRGYGHSFVNSICALLPEIDCIRDFQEGAENSLSQSVAENVIAIQAFVEQLKTSCSCRDCTNQPALISRYHSCNVAFLLSLRHLGDIMAHVDTDPLITPTRDGLETAYSMQQTKWSLTKNAKPTQGLSYLGMIMGIPHASESMEDIKRFYSRGKFFLLDWILDEVSRLFVGRGHHSEFGQRIMHCDKPQCTALSRAGVCIWLDALRSAYVDPGSMSTVHVVPGQIMYKKRTYAPVGDLSPVTTESFVNIPVVGFSMF